MVRGPWPEIEDTPAPCHCFRYNVKGRRLIKKKARYTRPPFEYRLADQDQHRGQHRLCLLTEK